MGRRASLLRALEADPTVAAQAEALDPALVQRLTHGVRGRIAPASRPRSVSLKPLSWAALAACALGGIWVGWTAPGPSAQAATGPTLLAALEITPIAEPPP